MGMGVMCVLLYLCKSRRQEIDRAVEALVAAKKRTQANRMSFDAAPFAVDYAKRLV